MDQQNHYEDEFLKIDRTKSSPIVYFQNTTHQFSISHPESRVLQCLLEQRETVSKATLLEAGWGRSEHLSENSLPVAISRLRKILKIANADIINTPRVGYKIEFSSVSSETIATPNDLSLEASATHLRAINIKRTLFNIGIILMAGGLILLWVNTLGSWVYVSCNKQDEKEVCQIGGIIYEINLK
ncbi:helix-turn-helix domain-containing protein [Vibrio aquaticus]|uniref:Helix-turn-helix domain-containing protein n=1 Tax=Vibrio aquaticus TaxID=2496559 RepID=A0A3S0MLA3_9VIBR|nr:helix-turn-helix domain-containing protein [Vibrio aquaticus]RTZ17689.1 helix-turn-helix domain-containing protein [Vibrio aquaticus]